MFSATSKSISDAYEDIQIVETVSRSINQLSQAYEEIKIGEAVSAYYEEKANEWGKAYDEINVSKSLGDLYDGFVLSIFGNRNSTEAPQNNENVDVKSPQNTTGQVTL